MSQRSVQRKMSAKSESHIFRYDYRVLGNSNEARNSIAAR